MYAVVIRNEDEAYADPVVKRTRLWTEKQRGHSVAYRLIDFMAALRLLETLRFNGFKAKLNYPV